MSLSDTGNEPENDAAPGEQEFLNPTPILAELEKGPWPSFVRGIKELAERTRKPMLRGVLDQLEYSYKTKTGYWEGGLVTVRGYGSGIVTRRSKIQDRFPEAREFHTLRVQPAPGLHYNTGMLRDLCDTWEKHGSGIIALHGQTGDIMLKVLRKRGSRNASMQSIGQVGTSAAQVLPCGPVPLASAPPVASTSVMTPCVFTTMC